MAGIGGAQLGGVAAWRGSLVVPVYSGVLFASAFLLFAVQPMFTKMVLPKLGGTPAVWSVATVFFQAVLLAGYGYAHVLATRLTPRTAALVHIAVMAAALGTSLLPLGLAAGFERPPAEGATLWLITLFAVSIGLPFFAVSAHGPLLQAWFARTGHPHRRDPYFLYGASNVGSFLALLSYPVAIEPMLSLSQQARAWTLAFVALVAGIALCAGYALAQAPAAAAALPAAALPAAGPTPSWRQRAQWAAYALVPSGLLVAVTAHISTDVAAAPFLWVVPLALFLLTFVITFQREPWLRRERALRLQPIFVAVPIVSASGSILFGWELTLGVSLAGFFLTAMVCHGELVRRRPPARHLTEFYCWMSFGGVLGGVFSALIAPNLFNWIVEYPLFLIAGLLCRPDLWDRTRRRANLIAIAALAALGVLASLPNLLFGIPLASAPGRATAFDIALLLTAAAIMLQARHPGRMIGLAVFALIVCGAYKRNQTEFRSFFGVHRIMPSADGRFRLLYHGTTLHGAQMLADLNGQPATGRPEPLAYYFDRGPIAQAIEASRELHGRLKGVGIVGVGAGSLACYRRPGESWTFYDIDPEVVRIARDPSYFTFIPSCAADAPMVLGDARLTLADAPDGAFDVLVIDAFSSDAIPVHLLTKEAVALYRRKLSSRGIVVMHISNRNVKLKDVVAAVAAENRLVTFVNRPTLTKALADEMKSAAEVAVLARRETDVGALAAHADWRRQLGGGLRPWTDDYANVVGAIWRRYTE
jgi:hypothetical protein